MVAAPLRGWINGNDPSAADLSAYHPIWFARQNGGSEVNELIAFATTIDPWYKRVGAVGHGKFSEMTPDQAIDAAKANEPSEPDGWLPEAKNVGLVRGDWVSVTPDDYGNPVCGSLLAWTADEVVVRHEDASVGKVNLHFPRVGFDTRQRRESLPRCNTVHLSILIAFLMLMGGKGPLVRRRSG
jgi:hypothetical protein